MKNQLLLIVMLFAFTACKKENTPKIALNEKVDLTMATQNAVGTFANGPYGSVSGNAKIYTVGTGNQLALENFSSSNGPDLKVYLSKEKEPQNFINLGDLKAVGGNQIYQIPAGINATEYKYALIYCKRFSHLFGFAQLN
ncbi:MAG: DM13 domain-containing protein [Bacteroidota bacterium]